MPALCPHSGQMRPELEVRWIRGAAPKAVDPLIMHKLPRMVEPHSNVECYDWHGVLYRVDTGMMHTEYLPEGSLSPDFQMLMELSDDEVRDKRLAIADRILLKRMIENPDDVGIAELKLTIEQGAGRPGTRPAAPIERPLDEINLNFTGASSDATG